MISSSPADLRGALNAIANTTVDTADTQKAQAEAQAKKDKKAAETAAKKRASTSKPKPTPKKPAAKNSKKKPNTSDTSSEHEEAYHFIGYVPAFGKVWELDGLKTRPLEVGELVGSDQWMDVARPALRMKMAKYGGGSDAGDANIRFSLLALVDGTYENANDEWEYWRRERRVIERRLDETGGLWRATVSRCLSEINLVLNSVFHPQVDPELIAAAEHAFTLPDTQAPTPGRMFLQGGAERLARDAEILTSSPDTLTQKWEAAVRNALRTKVAVEDEVSRAMSERVSASLFNGAFQ